jgi:hypothetical protein
MTMNDVTAVLSLTKSMAEEREWTRVADFLSDLPAEDDNGVLVLTAEGIDARTLVDWIGAAVRGAPLSTGPLQPMKDNPTAALAANRVVIVFQCGRLFKAEEVDAANEILSRPPMSYAIVFVGAEAMQDLHELNLVERGIWQVLVGEPGVRWAGQDVAERRCLLWSEAAAANAVADRIARDRALLEQWLRSPVAPSQALAGLRADYALQLAEQEIAATASDVPVEESAARAARLRAVRVSLETLHQRLLRRLDDDAASVERQITSSLELLQQRLIRDVGVRMEREGNRLRLGDVRQDVDRMIRESMDGWRAETVAAIERRARETGDETNDLLDDVDWNLINDVSPAPGGASYPDVILVDLRTQGEVDFANDEPTAGPVLPVQSAPSPWVPVIRMAACGAGFAAVAAVFAAPAVTPIVAAGAVGVIGGGLVNWYIGTVSDRRAATVYAQAAVSRAIGSALTTVREQLREATMPTRRAVAADFRDIERALHAAMLQALAPTATAPGRQPPADPGRAGDSSDAPRLAALRQRLTQAQAGLEAAPDRSL